MSEPPPHREVIETPETSTSYHFGVPGSEPPSHREVIETLFSACITDCTLSKCLNHPFTARCLKSHPDIRQM